jgi:hypothetical protein
MSDSEDKERTVKPWDMLNPKQPRSTKELQSERLAICTGCEFFNHITAGCKKCGCFMKVKTKLENATCPVGKW